MAKMATRRLSCGLDLCCVPDLNGSLAAATSSGYDFIATAIVHPRHRRELISGKAKELRKTPLTRSDILLNGQDWNSLVVGKVSPYLNLDSADEEVRKQSQMAFEQEIQYASHLGVPAVMLPPLTGFQPNLARHVYSRAQAVTAFQGTFQFWVRVPMQAPSRFSKKWLTRVDVLDDTVVPDDDDDDYGEDTWQWWNYFRSMCDTDRKIGIALELASDLPSEEFITRWLGEPVRCLLIPTSIFLTNRKGFPVLSKSHQSVIQRFYAQDTQLLITGNTRHHHIKLYHQYMDFLWQNQLPEDPVTQYARGYEDYLQCPLQPLMDNLEAQTYEIFEKDPVKYTEYQKAMYHAILDKVPFAEKDTTVVVLMVVGAGRGPLVRAALMAAENADRKIKVYAVEKNPNAVVTLLTCKTEEWGDSVTVVSCDMREWDPPEKADILVSELLGSFGDNELSPECLDGAQKVLKDDGVSIPESYTSYICPIHSPKLHCELNGSKERERVVRVGSAFEMPYVVRLHNKVALAAPVPVFTFIHPNNDELIDNSRYENLTFKINMDGVLHGFAGYFDTVLYKNITLSILPETHSHGMFSWFPMFFPIKHPIRLRKDSTLVVNFWRRVSTKNVWYEWCVTSPEVTHVHNINGRSYTIGL